MAVQYDEHKMWEAIQGWREDPGRKVPEWIDILEEETGRVNRVRVAGMEVELSALKGLGGYSLLALALVIGLRPGDYQTARSVEDKQVLEYLASIEEDGELMPGSGWHKKTEFGGNIVAVKPGGIYPEMQLYHGGKVAGWAHAFLGLYRS